MTIVKNIINKIALYLWNEVGQLLQFQHLEVHATALVGHHKERIQRALGSTSLFSIEEIGF